MTRIIKISIAFYALIAVSVFISLSCSDNSPTPAEPLPPCPEKTPTVYDLWPLKTGYTATYNADVFYERTSGGRGEWEKITRKMKGKITLEVEEWRGIGDTDYYRVKRTFEIDQGHFALFVPDGGPGYGSILLEDYYYSDTTIVQYSIIAYKNHAFWYADTASSFAGVENRALSLFIRGWVDDWIVFDSRIFLLDEDVFRKKGSPSDTDRLGTLFPIPLVISQEGDNGLETDTYNYGNTFVFLKSGGLKLLEYGGLTTIELLEQTW